MKNNKESYKQIFKSTSIVGGSQVVNILIGVIRTKAIALLLGPGGVGIAGIFQAIIDMVRNATGFGVNFSGVKSVAENNTDPVKVARTILILRRWEFSTGLIGMVVTILLSYFFSIYSFGNSSYTVSIAVMSVILLINAVSAGQLAILQGLRQIQEMAKASFWGAVLGMFISLPIYWWFGISGMISAMVLTALSSLAVSRWFAKKIITENIQLSFKETFNEGLGMARLGFFIVVNGFIATASLYVIRTLIRANLGVEHVGYFQAVWTISTLYINILLNAMLADYFPRLSTIKNDTVASNQLINEQVEMTILIGTPMLAVMIAFAAPTITILYSSSFHAAIPVLKWQMAASFITFLSWPLGVLYLSKDKGVYAIISETIRQIVYIFVIFTGWRYAGFNILGIGFFIANICGLIFVYISVVRLNTFAFTKVNIKYIFILGTALLLILFVSLQFTNFYQYIINGAVLIFIAVFCFNKVDKLLGIKNRLNIKYIRGSKKNN